MGRYTTGKRFITPVSANFIPDSTGAPRRGRNRKHYFCHNFQVQRRDRTLTLGIGWTRRGFVRGFAWERLATILQRAKCHMSFNLGFKFFARFTVSAKNGSYTAWLELITMLSSAYVTVYIIINILSKCLPQKNIKRCLQNL